MTDSRVGLSSSRHLNFFHARFARLRFSYLSLPGKRVSSFYYQRDTLISVNLATNFFQTTTNSIRTDEVSTVSSESSLFSI
jgi:hypothetical protein